MRLAKTIVVGVAAALVLSACAGGGANDGTTEPSDLPAGVSLREDGAYMLERNAPVTGGTLRIAMLAPTEALDPARSEGSGPAAIMRAIFDTLVNYDENGQVVPNVAESLETADKGKTWVLKLPTGVKFTDGTVFDAQAVVSHWTRIGAEGSTSRQAAEVRAIESLTVTNPTTVTIVLKAPSLTFPKVLLTNPGHMNFIPSPASVAQWGAQVGFHPVGLGAFKMKNFTSGGNAILERNADYWRDGLPYLDELHYIVATDTQARLSAAVAGDLDLAPTQMAVDAISAEAQGLTSLYQPTFTYFNFLFNLKKPPFDDIRFREAVIRGIDLNALNASVFEGEHNVMTGIFPKDNPFYADTDWPSFDADKAKKLVKEWAADTGLAPEFNLTTTSPPEFQKQAAIIQQMLKDVGITMNINVGDQPTMISEGRTGNYTAQHRFVGVLPEVDGSLFSNFYSGSAANNGQAGDPKVDELLLKARTLTEVEDRRKVYKEMQEAFREWLPMMPLVQHKNAWYVGDKVGGFPGVLYGIDTPDVAQLYISK